MLNLPFNLLEKFASYVEVQENGCWYFGSTKTKSGYKQLMWKELIPIFNGPIFAHRLAYLLENGEIDPGYVIDHDCHNLDPSCPNGAFCQHRRCVNPDHLVSRTPGDNIRRGQLKNRLINTKCPSGHEFTTENTFYIGNQRRCKECNRAKAAAYHKRTRPEVDHTRCKNGHAYTEEKTLPFKLPHH